MLRTQRQRQRLRQRLRAGPATLTRRQQQRVAPLQREHLPEVHFLLHLALEPHHARAHPGALALRDHAGAAQQRPPIAVHNPRWEHRQRHAARWRCCCCCCHVLRRLGGGSTALESSGGEALVNEQRLLELGGGALRRRRWHPRGRPRTARQLVVELLRICARGVLRR